MTGAAGVDQVIPSFQAEHDQALICASGLDAYGLNRGRVSAIVVSYHTGEDLFACIQSVLSAPDIDELILVNHDNPSETVERLEALASENDKLRILHTGDNLGFSRGCNHGAALARYDYLLFLNPDATVDPGGAEHLTQTVEAFAEPTIVGCRLMDTAGCEQRGGRRGHLTLGTAIRAFLGWGDSFHRESDPLPEGPVLMPTVSGAAMMMSRKGFEVLGGFDEGYFLHVEDIDICKRAWDAGGEVVFEPGVAIRHVGSTSDISTLQVDVFKALGLMRYFSKHGGVTGPLKGVILAPFFLFGAVVRNLVLRFKQIRRGAVAPAE